MAYEEHMLRSVMPDTMTFDELYTVIEKDVKATFANDSEIGSLRSSR